MADRPDIWKVANALQMNLRACQAQLVELRGMLSRLDVPASTEIDCPLCGLRTKGPRTLSEHLYQMHNGGEPETWAEIDRRTS